MKVKGNHWFFNRHFLPFAPDQKCEWSDEKEEYVYYTTTCNVALSVLARLALLTILIVGGWAFVIYPIITVCAAWFGWNPLSMNQHTIESGFVIVGWWASVVLLGVLLYCYITLRNWVTKLLDRTDKTSGALGVMRVVAVSMSDRWHKICRRIDFEE